VTAVGADRTGGDEPAEMPAGAVTGAPTRRGRLRVAAAARGVPLATIITAVAVVAFAYLAGKLIYRLRDVVLMMMVAGFIALILNPLVVYLQHRWNRRRGWAVAVVTIWAALVFTGLVLAFGHPLVHGLTHLSQRLPAYVQDAQHGHGPIGHLVRRFHLAAWAQRNTPRLRSLGAGLAKPALTVGKGAVSLVVTLGTIAVLVLLLLLEGPKMRRGLLSLMPPERASRYARIAHGGDIHRQLGRRFLRQLRSSPDLHPGRGRPADTREGTVAGDRPGRATRRRAGIADGINT
jgi:predicted PurR-regulated permease PerM